MNNIDLINQAFFYHRRYHPEIQSEPSDKKDPAGSQHNLYNQQNGAI